MNASEELARRQAIASIFAVGILYTFGSRGEEVGGRELSVEEKVNLAIALEDLLGVNRVDLVGLVAADPFCRRQRHPWRAPFRCR